MSREEAIEVIQNFMGWFKPDSRIYKALKMAISALLENEELSKDLDEALREIDEYEQGKKDALSQELCQKDCRLCKEFDECVNGRKGHINGTSIGYSIGECKDYEPCDDAISRQSVLDIVDSYSESQSNVEDVTQDMISDILALPSVTHKSGKWILTQQGDRYADYYCSECGNELNLAYCTIKDEQKKGRCLYCDHCGAEMSEKESENDR